MSFIRSINLILTLKCREASALIAEGADRDLSRSERWALRLHLAYCSSCRRFRQQLAFLRRLLKGLEQRLAAGDVPLEEGISEAARGRLERIIESNFPQ
jgi:predicted anti-sigma-YlaC factor YlaD